MRRLAIIGVAGFLAMLVGRSSGEAGQTVSPAVEIGAHAGVLGNDAGIGRLVGPRVVFHLAPKIALAGSFDVERRTGRVSGQSTDSRAVYLQLKRTVYASRTFTASALLGGGITDERLNYPTLLFETGTGTTTLRPAVTRRSGPAAIGGIALDWTLAEHIAIFTEAEVVVPRQAAGVRLAVGVSTPIGRFSRRPARPSFAIRHPFARLSVDDDVWITTSDGRQIAGIVKSLAAAAVEVSSPSGLQTVAAAAVRKIDVADPISDGAVRGALVGGLGAGVPAIVYLTALCANEGCHDSGIGLGLTIAAGGALFGGLGAAIADSLIKGRRTIYESTSPSPVQVVPVIGRRAAGIGVAINWP